MSPKWAKKAHFGDISYNVFNRRKSSYLMLETLYFTIPWRIRNWYFLTIFLIFTNTHLSGFWCYRVYIMTCKQYIYRHIERKFCGDHTTNAWCPLVYDVAVSHNKTHGENCNAVVLILVVALDNSPCNII